MTRLTLDGSSLRLWLDGPAWQGAPAAAAGELDFVSPEAGAALLEQAATRARAAGLTGLLAPMDGDTWHAYRAVIESDGSPPFRLEPRSGSFDVAALEAAGLQPVERYMSSRAPLPPASDPAPMVPGITVISWDGQGAEALLERLYAMAGESFADKLFFKPATREQFLGLYRPLLPLIDPRLVLFALDTRGAMQGFLFGLPDGDTAILKTYASAQSGVGHLLAHRFHALARDLGFKQVVHALMHEANLSLRRSEQHRGTVFRRYALYGRRW
jgi:hypothetical protein